MIYSIVCVDKEFGIGKNNDLLFHLKEDMKFFRETTKGHTVFLGSNTLLSFPNSKPLKNRTNVVLSFDLEFEGCVNVHDFNEFIKLLKEYGEKEDVFVIGGASVYKQTLPYVDRVLVTKVDAVGGATVFFDNLDENPNFECIKVGEPVQDEGYTIRFCEYKRIS